MKIYLNLFLINLVKHLSVMIVAIIGVFAISPPLLSTGIFNISSRDEAAAISIPDGVDEINVHGFYRAGDGGQATYRRIRADERLRADEPLGPWEFRSKDGSLWLINQPVSGVNIRQLGARGDMIFFDGEIIQSALNKFAQIYIPSGNWVVDNLSITRGRTIHTDGFETKIIQRRQPAPNKPIISIIGSEVRLGSIYLRGNIDYDVGEWNAGLTIIADRTIGNINNILIKDIMGENIRGDVVYIGSKEGKTTSDISIKNVFGRNIYRNTLSIVGGRNIRIESISGFAIGYKMFDIEPEIYTSDVSDISIGSISGGCNQIASSSPLIEIANIRINSITSEEDAANSTPPYPLHDCSDQLILRNLQNLHINSIFIKNFQNSIIKSIFNKGERGVERLEVSALKSTAQSKRVAIRSVFDVSHTGLFILSNVDFFAEDDIVFISGPNVIMLSNIKIQMSNKSYLINNVDAVSMFDAFIRGGFLLGNVNQADFEKINFRGKLLGGKIKSVVFRKSNLFIEDNLLAMNNKHIQLFDTELSRAQ